MIKKYSQLKNNEITEPESSIIFGAGFVSPDGIPFDCDSMNHGHWMLEYKNWLKSEGYSLSEQGSDDSRRIELVKQGWIHVFTPEMISIWKYTPEMKQKIKDIYFSGDIDNSSYENKVEIVEQSSGKSYFLKVES